MWGGALVVCTNLCYELDVEVSQHIIHFLLEDDQPLFKLLHTIFNSKTSITLSLYMTGYIVGRKSVLALSKRKDTTELASNSHLYPPIANPCYLFYPL